MKSYRRRGGHLGGELAGSLELGQDPLGGKLEGVRATEAIHVTLNVHDTCRVRVYTHPGSVVCLSL